jgi:hypothetical protein
LRKTFSSDSQGGEPVTYAFTQDLPIDAAFYMRIKEGLGDDPPQGMISHLAVALPEGGLRYIDVWESEQDWDRFVEERLHPVVHPLLVEIFGEDLPPEPERTALSVIDLWRT